MFGVSEFFWCYKHFQFDHFWNMLSSIIFTETPSNFIQSNYSDLLCKFGGKFSSLSLLAEIHSSYIFVTHYTISFTESISDFFYLIMNWNYECFCLFYRLLKVKLTIKPNRLKLLWKQEKTLLLLVTLVLTVSEKESMKLMLC